MDIRQALEEIVARLQEKHQGLTGTERIATARQIRLAKQLLSAIGTTEKPAKEEPRHEDDDDFPEGDF